MVVIEIEVVTFVFTVLWQVISKPSLFSDSSGNDFALFALLLGTCFINCHEISSLQTGCKIVMTLFHYFLATNYYWILV